MARRRNAPQTSAPPAAPVVTKSPEELLRDKAIEISTLTVEAFDALSPDEQAPHIEAARSELEKEPAAPPPDPPQERKVKLVKMKRDAEQYPEGPHEAEVHPDEVENYKAGGFTEV